MSTIRAYKETHWIGFHTSRVLQVFDQIRTVQWTRPNGTAYKLTITGHAKRPNGQVVHYDAMNRTEREVFIQMANNITQSCHDRNIDCELNRDGS